MNNEERKKFLKVIQGKLPTEKQMRNKLPGMFKKLKKRLEAVEDIDTQGIEVTKEMFNHLEIQFGPNLERNLHNR